MKMMIDDKAPFVYV